MTKRKYHRKGLLINMHDAGAPTGMLHPHFLGTLIFVQDVVSAAA